MVSLEAISETASTPSTAAAAKVKAYLHLLQVSDIAVQVYPALHSMQVKVLPTKFQGRKICG